MQAKIKISIKQSSGDTFDVEVAPEATVLELKTECATKMETMKAEEMRLIYKGKILKDEQTLDSYKITDGMVVHLVKGKSAAGAKPADTTQSTTSTSSLEAGTGAGLGAGGLGAGGAQPNPFGGMGQGMP